MTHPQLIRVLIVDDHAVVRSGLSTFISAYDDLVLVGQAASGAEAVALAQQARPDVVLMDLILPEMGGTTATRLIREACPDIEVIALTNYRDADLVQEALKAGAIGYVLKDVSAEELAEAIRAAQAGRPTLAPEAAQALINAANQGPRMGHDLTDRERQVLALMAAGRSNREIAGELVISRSTVKVHVSSILTKLDVETRTEAVGLATQHHLVGQ
jgi:two-component system, NarL family, response regulator LiaR